MTEPGLDGRDLEGGTRSRYARPIPPANGAPRPETRFIAPHQPRLPHEPVRHAPAGPRRRALAAAARIGGPPAALAILATVALAVALATVEGSRTVAVNGWLLTIGGLVVLTFWRALAGALPAASVSASPFDTVRVRRTEPPSKLHDVIAIEGVLLDAEWSRGGVEYRLRPLLRKIAAARLLEHHQVDLATEPDAARKIVGDELWSYIGPRADAGAGVVEPAHLGEAAEADLAAPARPLSEAPTPPRSEWLQARHGRHGIPRATIRRVIDQLEAL